VKILELSYIKDTVLHALKDTSVIKKLVNVKLVTKNVVPVLVLLKDPVSDVVVEDTSG
jgi:hypothetical protein